MIENVFENGLPSQQHIIVPIAEDAISFPLNFGGANIVTRGQCMLTAVDFNDDSALEAYEIQNVAPKWNLPPKFETR
jgi:hypothetical protein